MMMLGLKRTYLSRCPICHLKASDVNNSNFFWARVDSVSANFTIATLQQKLGNKSAYLLIPSVPINMNTTPIPHITIGIWNFFVKIVSRFFSFNFEIDSDGRTQRLVVLAFYVVFLIVFVMICTLLRRKTMHLLTHLKSNLYYLVICGERAA